MWEVRVDDIEEADGCKSFVNIIYKFLKLSGVWFGQWQSVSAEVNYGYAGFCTVTHHGEWLTILTAYRNITSVNNDHLQVFATAQVHTIESTQPIGLEGAHQFLSVEGTLLWGICKLLLELYKRHNSKSTGHHGNCCGCRVLFRDLQTMQAKLQINPTDEQAPFGS